MWSDHELNTPTDFVIMRVGEAITDSQIIPPEIGF
jgi:hypothetical protein